MRKAVGKLDLCKDLSLIHSRCIEYKDPAIVRI